MPKTRKVQISLALSRDTIKMLNHMGEVQSKSRPEIIEPLIMLAYADFNRRQADLKAVLEGMQRAMKDGPQ